ncbi:TRAP transporter small permease [Hoeflea prorocentri]|uniref:TRAP transporter small permease protein n=1 Tax=Hoeflea prorocentri TaxID=1922333 RepID=A0A9X3ZIL6_9HYPH|nr:TRAP transporter small permease [Hoeflea prorocentri]MCY6381855.1 TRAP transporter small permease [Hoeflea prorocentri]MDA5399655.1 TRAP transporter small permease [Hoeflea prorocentri]
MTRPSGSLGARALETLKLLLGLALVLMVVLNIVNAAGRYGGLPVPGGMDELLVIAMIWVVMIGCILATHDRTHLAINLLPQSLNNDRRRVLETLVTFLTAGVCAFVAWHSWTFIERIGAIGQKSMGLGVPMVVPHLAIFVGFAGTALVSLVLAVTDCRAFFQDRAK